jgi:hypothetical protein
MDKDEARINFVKNRRDICDTCEHLTLLIGLKTCNKCGCSIWGKTLLRGSSCPIGKWNIEKID